MKRSQLLFSILLLTQLIFGIFLVPPLVGYAQTSLDWSQPVNLSNSGTAGNPIIVIDINGIIHAIWIDTVVGEYKYSQSQDGINWSLAQTVKFPFGEDDDVPILLADENGSIHVFWISADQDLFYGQATPSNFSKPSSWRTTSRLARDALAFDVVLDARGILHLTYVSSSITDATPAGVYYRQSIIGGGFWSVAIPLYESEYFRSAGQDEVNVRVSSSNSLSDQKIFVSWDNRAQKRVFISASEDSGVNWGNAQQFKSPADTGGIDTPFNLTVSAYENNVLLIWQVGEIGSSRCTVYSQWSDDAGASWGDVVAVLGGRSECPLSIKVMSKTSDYMSVMFTGQTSSFMTAWNGVAWSDIQVQTQFPTFSNPLTFDAIILGCRYDLIKDNRLYVVGCDQGRGKDVWFLSRTIEPVDNWFSPSSIWGEPVVLIARSKKPEKISNFQTTTDLEGNIHALWVQSPFEQGNTVDMAIKYARWDGQKWSNPESVITSLKGMPIQMFVTSDSLNRLLLTWIDGYNGDLIFTWTDLEQANLASAWVDVTGVPIPSRLVNSSDVAVDGSGRIINVYAIPINEKRGIYVTQSTDSGKNWSSPVRVFDAVSAGWENIDQPRISIGPGGVLHLVFIRNTVRVGQTVGLFYTRSVDGGETWSDAQNLSERDIQWADVVAYGDRTVHVIWQEFDGLVFANVSQVSQDDGKTWGKQNNVTGVNEEPTTVTIASQGERSLHFIQFASRIENDAYKQRGFVLQDWKWDDANWKLELSKDYIVKGDDITNSLSAVITPKGFLNVFIPIDYDDFSNAPQSEILAFSRYLDDVVVDQTLKMPIIPTSIGKPNDGEGSMPQPSPTPDYSILYDNNDLISPLQRNITGLALIGIGMIAAIILLLRRRS